ncbi:MAG: hypothetical protein ABIO40_04870, partial [Devosia sp.]
GAIGVALVGEIFFTSLGAGLASGANPHAVFASSASLAILYVIVSFGSVAALVWLLRPLNLNRDTGTAATAPPVSAEA